MQDFDDIEPSDDELKEVESDEITLDVDTGFGVYALQTDRIRLLADLIESFNSQPGLENICLIVQDELKLLLADQEPLSIAKLTSARAARLGQTIKGDE